VIIELDKLKREPCEYWLRLFEDGKLDVHQAFKEHYSQYDWLYDYSDYDLIAWQIENECFNWEKDSWAVAAHCSHLLDPKLYNWEDYSCHVAQFCSRLLDPERYNWEKHTWYVELFCPRLLPLKPKKL